MNRKKDDFGLFFAVGVCGVRFTESFGNGATLSNGTAISGGAAVLNGELLLSAAPQERYGGFHVPALASSSLGWTATFTARFVGAAAVPADGLWLTWGNNTFNVSLERDFVGVANNANVHFLAWLVDTSQNRGFFVVNSTGVRTTAGSRIGPTVSLKQPYQASIFVAWNPQRGASFRTTGFASDVNLADVPLVHTTASDLHTWSFTSGGAVPRTEVVALDNVVIDAPCGDCRAGGGVCYWQAGGQLYCHPPLDFFVRNSAFVTGRLQSNRSFGSEFTVYSAIDVVAIGLLDADRPGINGTLTARIFDRATDQVVAGPVVANAGESRTSDTFVFKPVQVRLLPGVYSLLADGFVSDFFSDGGAVDNLLTPVLYTASVVDGDGVLASTTKSTGSNRVLVGATFRYHIVDRTWLFAQQMRESGFSQSGFASCEAVACAGLPTGEHHVSGAQRFCDNDAAGGGWLRLWRADEKTCESNGWTSARNPLVTGVDPFGCRARSASCAGVPTAQAPYLFRQVRGGNWGVWTFGTPDGLNASVLCDGIVVRDADDGLVWMFAVGQDEGAQLCPCEATFVNSSATVASLNIADSRWTCDRAPARGASWERLFHSGSANLCAPNALATSGDRLWFQRTLATPQHSLRVAICKDSGADEEDLKLTSGELFVRSTINFDKRRCLTTSATTTATQHSLSTSTLTSVTATASTNSTAPPSMMTDAPLDILLIAGVAGGGFVVVLLLVAAAICVVVQVRKSRRRRSADVPMSVASNYGAILPVPMSAAHGEYASARNEHQHYAQTAAAFKVDEASAYATLTPSESGQN